MPEMRTIFFRGQGSYRNGTCMCTTACLQLAMAVLCRKISLADDEERSLRDKIDRVMALASRSHAKLEWSHSSARMVSVNEIIRECCINLQRLTIDLEEFSLVSASSSSSKKCEVLLAPQGHPMKYRATSCLVEDLQQLPMCMETSLATSVSAAIATSNSHSVCLLWYQGNFAFFDPLPGTLCLELSSSEMLDKMCDSLHLVLLPDNVDRNNTPSSPVHYRKGKKVMLTSTASPQEEMGLAKTAVDMINSATKRLKSSLYQYEESSRERQLQQCDVSLMFKKNASEMCQS